MPEKRSAEERLVEWRDKPHKRGMIVTNTDTIPDAHVTEILGVVRGNTVRAKHLGKDIMAGFGGIVGGEIYEYTELLSEARDEAYGRMVRQAVRLGADAVVNVRFVTSMIAASMSELLAYGTAVRLRRDGKTPEEPCRDESREVIDRLTRSDSGGDRP